MRDRPHSEAMPEQLRADPAYAAELLADVLRVGSPAELAILSRLERTTRPSMPNACESSHPLPPHMLILYLRICSLSSRIACVLTAVDRSEFLMDDTAA